MYTSKFSLALTAVLFFSFLNWSCTKIDTTGVGSGLIPGVDNVNTFDTTLTVISNNIDSVDKDCATVYPEQEHVLGLIANDPYFGLTRAFIYTEFKPATFPFKFPGGTRTIDSVVLVLSYKRVYGDSTVPQKVNVYEIFESAFKPDSSTCTYHDFNTFLGSVIYTPKKTCFYRYSEDVA